VKKKSSKLTEKELFSSCVLEKAGKYDKSYWEKKDKKQSIEFDYI
jgi:hypothetical protein